MITICTILLCTLCFGIVAGNASATQFEYDVIESILNSDLYDSEVRPDIGTGLPTSVYVHIYVIQISEMDEIHMSYNVDMFFHQVWTDERLQSPDVVDSITLGHKFIDKIWVPDTYFKNEKTAHLHKITVPNIMLTLDPDGTIQYSQRLTVQFSCDFKFETYPFDEQICEMQIESYGYHSDELALEWAAAPALENDTLSLPEFEITDIKLIENVPGDYSYLTVVLTLQRLASHHLIHTYVPSVLIVILSWISFWIDYKSVPARISLGLLTVLTITTQTGAVNAKLPTVTYTMAIDVWMSACLVFVFMAFIEYSFVNILARRNILKVESKTTEILQGDEENGTQKRTKDKSCCWFPRRYKMEPALYIDVVSRFVFPLFFVIFNIGYWTVYPPVLL